MFYPMLIVYQLFVAWLAGARFDIAYYQMKEQLGGLMGWTSSNMTKIAEVTKIVEAVPEHSEL
jgi:farnesyl-diphosphate farnesyltransferase